jgi:hypoxanthine phosphoribosyltransferase
MADEVAPEAVLVGDTVDGTRFAHASEAEMARILDFYAVRWEYEPTTFPILWNLDGDVIESFAPDFYLPELEMFLEMTTLKQRLVRKKNRKLRRLRELYPDIRIKLFYARDFRAMMLKYGRLALAEALSGTHGQVVPDRAHAAAVVAASGAADPGVVLEPAAARVSMPTGAVADLDAEPREDSAPVLGALPSLDAGDVAVRVPAHDAGVAPSVRPAPRARNSRRRRRGQRAIQVVHAGIEPDAGA